MMMSLRRAFNRMSQDEGSWTRRGKKAIFALLLLSVLSVWFPTVHNGDLIDCIWSNLYWGAPILALGIFLILLYSVGRRGESEL